MAGMRAHRQGAEKTVYGKYRWSAVFRDVVKFSNSRSTNPSIRFFQFKFMLRVSAQNGVLYFYVPV